MHVKGEIQMTQLEGQLRNARTSRTGRIKGGQHRVPVGASTFDDETPAETAERHRRAIEEFNVAMQEAVSQQFGQKF